MQCIHRTIRLFTLIVLVCLILAPLGGAPVAAQQLAQATPTPPAITAWNGTSRLTFVVMGIDRRPDQEGLGYRTDAIMLISLDPQTAQIGIMSIPRDLFVAVPNYAELQRVNTILVLGELVQAGYGPTLMMETMQLNFGIRLHGYLIVDFDAFVALVDAIGGVQIETTYTIDDPTYPDMDYGYDPFYLPAGIHLLDGATALKFARTRHGDNIFLRAERQMQLMEALRARLVAQIDDLGAFLPRVPGLFNDLRDNLYTNFTVDHLLQLGMYALTIPTENLTTGSLDERYVMDFIARRGTIMVPNRETLATLMVEIFGENYAQ